MQQALQGVTTDEIYRRLQEYEDIGFSPSEEAALAADNARIHKFLDEIEEIITGSISAKCETQPIEKDIVRETVTESFRLTCDNRTFAKELREHTVVNEHEIVLVSRKLWEAILERIEHSIQNEENGGA